MYLTTDTETVLEPQMDIRPERKCQNCVNLVMNRSGSCFCALFEERAISTLKPDTCVWYAVEGYEDEF